MRLPIKNFLPKKEKPDYLLALLLEDTEATAVIIEQFQGKIKIVGQHTVAFTTSLEEATPDELLDVLDKAISRAEEPLPPSIETRKTVFGVKDAWVEEKKITKDHLAELKKVSEALDLIPVGFLVISEAVAHLIQEEEGAPLSAIIAEVGAKAVNLVLYRGGKAVDSHAGPIEESPMHTVDTLLKHFTIEVLPSRIIVVGGKKEQSLGQKFITHAWSKSLPFLHLPQISELPEDFAARSIVFGAATQMGLEVLGEVIDKTASEIKTYEHGAKTPLPVEEVTSGEATPQATSEENEPEGKALSSEKEKEKEAEEPGEDAIPLSGDNFGFVNDEDIAKVRPKHTSELSNPSASLEEIADESYAEEPESPSSSPLSRLTTLVPAILAPLSRLPALLGGSTKSLARVKGNKILLIPVLIILLLIVLGVLYVMNVRATVTLNLNPKVVQQSQTVTLSPDAVNDFSKHTIQASAVSSTLEGSVSTPATGKKDVGDKAKGTVTFYNNNDTSKTITSGTTITSSNNLSFTVDKDVSIASESGDIFTGTKPGTATVSVTAKDIGPEYNLPSSTKFSVSGASNVAAKNDTAFSGGSKKQVTVVSKSDIDKLLVDLPKSLEEKAKSDLGAKVEKDESMLPDFVDETVATKSFDKNVNDEAKTVTLKGKVTFEGLTYKNNDLQNFATSVLKNDYAQDLHISDKGVSAEIKDVKNKGDKTYEISLDIKADLLPSIDTDTVKKDVTGKSVAEATSALSSLPQVSSVDISLSPPIPFIPKFLPRFQSHITVEVKSNE